jgi:hypothetical protein
VGHVRRDRGKGSCRLAELDGTHCQCRFHELEKRNRFIYNAELCERSFTGSSLLTGLGSRQCQDCPQTEEAAPLVVPGAKISSHIMHLIGFEAVSSVR